MKHNDIVLELNNDKLTSLLCHKFGVMACWSCFGWVVKTPISDWEKQSLLQLLKHISRMNRRNFYDFISEDMDFREIELQVPKLSDYKNFEDIKDNFTGGKDDIYKIPKEKSLHIEKTFEFPLIKGTGHYKCTKGFIDLIVHCCPVQKHGFSTYNGKMREFIIEIKTEKDFDDFGNILRQIKEYKEYYDDFNVEKWNSKINDIYYLNQKRYYCILSTKIPKKIKTLFEDEGIMCLELDSLNNNVINEVGDDIKQSD